MSNQSYSITGSCKIKATVDGTKSKIDSVDILLETSSNVAGSFFAGDDVPTAGGNKALTNCFIQGLAATVHDNANRFGISKVEQLSKIMADLHRAIASEVTLTKSNWDK